MITLFYSFVIFMISTFCVFRDLKYSINSILNTHSHECFFEFIQFFFFTLLFIRVHFMTSIDFLLCKEELFVMIDLGYVELPLLFSFHKKCMNPTLR